MTFTDASFLVSFFAHDDCSPKAVRWWLQSNAVLTASRLVLFEAENSIRTMPLEAKCNAAEATWAVEKMKRAIAEGLIEVREPRMRRLYPAALRLRIYHSANKRFGAMDILHVATALHLGAGEFVSFDTRQRDLAEAEGMKVLP